MIRLNDLLSGPNMPLQTLCITCVLLLLSENSHALEWKDLWQTPDQQAQKAFQKQQYEQAAGQFAQPEWKAAAQYKAGQYQQVMDTLKDIHTGEGFYNQGNAYVKQGKLQEALEAYQKSLEIDPENADAKYNKKLIEKELEKQKQQQDQQQDQGDSGDQDQQDNSDSKNKDGEQGEQGDQSETDKDQKESESQAENQQDADKNDSEAKQEQSENQQQESDESTKEAESAKPSEEETGEDDAEASAVDQSNEPKDESEQASEQWLKRIPDDPAGLLKRKFEYQYKQRSRDSRDQQENW